MSLSMLIYIVSCIGFYKLGAFNQKHPGELWRSGQFFWKWLNQ